MKKIIPLLMLSLLTACTATSPVVNVSRTNPQMLSTNDLLKAQSDKIEKLERDMAARETALKFEHIEKMQTVQLRQAQQVPQTVNTQCKFFCF